MIEPIMASTFRKEMGPRLDAVLHDHLPLALQRRHELAVVVGASEMRLLVDDRGFHPEVGGGDDGVSVWLPELQIYGQGRSYDQAKDDLLSEVREYIREYLSDGRYLRASNRAAHFPYVMRAYLADRDGDLASVIFRGPPPGS